MIKKTPPTDIKCDVCKKTVPIVDSYIPFKISDKDKPSEYVLMCQKCVDKSMEEIRKSGAMPNHWMPADYEKKLAKELGFKWFTSKSNIWGYWKKES